MIQNGATGRLWACLRYLGSAPLDPPRNQICPKRSPDTKISQKSDSKTSTYHQKVVLKLKNHVNIDPNSNSKRNFNPNSNSNQNPNSNPNPNQNPNPNPNPKKPDPPNLPNQPLTKILNPPIRYSANPDPATRVQANMKKFRVDDDMLMRRSFWSEHKVKWMHEYRRDQL